MPRHEESVETKLRRIAEKAGREPKFQFTSLFHLMNEELLLGCFKRLKNRAAAGIDEVTKAEYAANLTDNVRGLVERLYRMGYRPQPVRRVYIPKAGSGKLRPLGNRHWKTSWCRRGWCEYSRRFMNRTSSTTPMDFGRTGIATTRCGRSAGRWKTTRWSGS